MSRARIDELIREIEALQTQAPPGPRGDDGPPSADIGSDAWFVKILREDFQPSVGGKLPDSIRQAIDTAYCKEKYLEKAGFTMLAHKWSEIGLRITEVAIDQFGFDTVMLDGMPDELLPLAITAADIREAVKDNPNWQTRIAAEKT